MGSFMRQAGEPSVEEILESIKKVIARDNRAEAAQARVRREPAAAAPAVVAPPAPPPLTDVLDLTDVASQILGAPTDDEAGDALLPEGTTASMRDSLAALAMLSQPGAMPQIVRSGETSIEELVRELLRPQLAAWLEQNLPAMVEKMVAAEIARIAGKKG